jgi:flagellar secretion chaperone FliS
MRGPALRARYLADTVSTASPAHLVVMLYDRLLLDLTHGETALRAGDRESASSRIMHAQDIILELRGALNVTSWAGAPGLSQLYSFLLTELIRANVRQDADRVGNCRELVAPLAQVWREADLGAEPAAGTPTPAAGGPRTAALRLAAGPL